MDERTVTVDPAGLRAVADAVERSANALSGMRFLSVVEVALPGSAVGGIAGPSAMAARLGGLARGLLGWAAAARAAAERFESVEQHNADRVDRA